MTISAPASRAGSRGQNRAAPRLRGERRVALEPGRLADEQHLHLVAALGEKPRRDKAVAAIVAGPGDHDDPAAGGLWRAAASATARPAFSIRSMPGDAAGDRQPVGLRHFGGAENFDHAAHRIAKAPLRGYRAARRLISCALTRL